MKHYVGARYVPKFSNPIEWKSGTAYEALTVVTYNSNSYTSKKPVPSTVGNPADNADYWALTGNYNAQVEDYRQTTLQVQENLNNTNQNLNNTNQNLNNTNQNLKNLIKGNFYNVKKTTNRYFLFCGDSYGDGGLGYSWVTDLAARLGLSSDQYTNACIAGSPFWNEGYLRQLKNFNGDKEKVTDILLCAGSNDLVYEYQNITENATTALTTFVNYANENYPNANVYLGMIGTRRNAEGTSGKGLAEHWWNIVQSYETACANAHATYLSNVETIWSRGVGMGIADGVHPSAGGSQYIALAIAIAWSGIRYTNIERDLLPYTPEGTDVSLPLIRTIYDGSYSLAINSIPDIKFNEATNITISGTKIGTLTDAYFNTPSYIPVQIVYNKSDGSGIQTEPSYIEFNGTDVIVGVQNTEGSGWKTISVQSMQVCPCNGTFPIVYTI